MNSTTKPRYLAERVATLKPSGIRKFFDIVATMKDVISLGIGEPDFTTPDSILQAGIRSLQSGQTHYTSNSGILELRRALSEHLNRLYGVSYDAKDELVISVGVSEALYLALTALLNPGEEVIIPTPCFVAYQAEVILAGGVPVEIPSRMENQFEPDPAEIEAAITPRTKAILLGYPNNPTGAVASRQVLTKIVEIAEKYDLMIISDEIYDQLVYGLPHVCVAALPGARQRTLLLGGFSKDYAMTGWRVGYAAGPEEFMQALLRIHQYTIMCAPTTAQDAALEALLHGQAYVDEMVAEYDRRRKLIVGGLNELGLATFEPRGAFYAFPNIRASGMDEDTFAQKLLEEERVAVIPGSAFGAGGEGFVRCSYATAYEKIEEALHRMERFMQRYG
ncbi:MAG: aminotransferase class I/II-fold pyridoxal phosphate-dependent enzyme [Anaerolineales bacterium]|jgi:aminotransferase|nr:aminotransferase class I/II-fold pyridoxal phosphate-dependent enzyme [Anaerolineales bacterium]